MTKGDKTDLKALAVDVDKVETELEVHPSIRALVQVLARKAAEEHYDELLTVMRAKFGDDIDV